MLKSRRLLGLVLSIFLACPALVCAKPKLVSSTGMIGDVVARVAGPDFDSETLLSSGVDPHLYKPTRADIAKLYGADVVFFNGLYLEGQMKSAFEKLKGDGRNAYALAERIPKSKLLGIDDFPGEYDPHIWMNPALWALVVGQIEEILTELYPTQKEGLEQRAENYRKELSQLLSYAERSLGSIPKAQRVLVTAHDAFQYFAQAFDLEVRGIQGLSTESEAGLRGIQRIIDEVVDRKVAVVFTETTISDRNVRAIVEGAAAKGHALRIGQSLFSDAMGSEGSYEGTYIGMLDHNITKVARGLGGNAPEKGFRGKLSAKG